MTMLTGEWQHKNAHSLKPFSGDILSCDVKRMQLEI